ncbi:hypothetical protein AVEN_101490-1 [Araneus ventricosus]|uniref:Uncharacterized protein n=1 Tax=Araneus ventricosus TaxID=182803 RepID=A0A4Y2FF38_ARAVE|nr:hypothetical protein AVEN_101490-1 [Araneus ventricosus]
MAGPSERRLLSAFASCPRFRIAEESVLRFVIRAVTGSTFPLMGYNDITHQAINQVSPITHAQGVPLRGNVYQSILCAIKIATPHLTCAWKMMSISWKMISIAHLSVGVGDGSVPRL